MKPERKQRMESVLANRQSDLVVVLENVLDPHNIGAVMRSAESVGVQEIFIIKTKIGAEEYRKKKSAGSAQNWLTIHHFDNVSECVTTLKNRGFQLWGTHLSAESVSLYEVNLKQPVALVFGSERYGLSDAILDHCSGNFVIPQIGMIKSLNISVACAISLYEAFRQRTSDKNFEPKRYSIEAKNELTKKWCARYEPQQNGND